MTTELIAGAGDSNMLGVRPGVTEAQTFLALIAARFNRPYANHGVGGDTSTQGRELRFAAILALLPKYIFIMYGINDWYYGVPVSTYKANLAWMIDQARAIGATPILFTPNLVRDAAFQAGMPPYVQACRELEVEKSVEVFDAYAMCCEGSVYPGGSEFIGWYPSVADTQHFGSVMHAKLDAMTALPQHADAITYYTPPPNEEGDFMVYTSPEQTIAASANIVLEHGLGAMPFVVTAWLKCISADKGYAAGRMLQTSIGASYDGTSRGLNVDADATELRVRLPDSTSGFIMLGATHGAGTLDASKWKLVFKAAAV